ncbi:uncharacterized protein LOC131165981 isoform X2 [Malania oleifera]|uniref:uncharacterized protein LOC131165981 isoform X2 n=1 Tax=Malania oleifera TaxID=397392 RepID=UPI0025AE4EF4|nr:uncharacterized protein LOC131165981 isoform X2 [Malania oleifera]
MSAKWRALQHRHRYTYSAVFFPHSYVESLNSLTSDSPSPSKFFLELKELISLNSTYAQVNHAKNVASAFGDLLGNGEEGLVSMAARFYLEILFLENSLPLHRTLVSVLAKNRNFQSLIGGCFRSLCKEYGGGKGKRFCVSRAALSMMSSPKLGYLVEVVEECAILVALDVLFGLNAVVSETIGWSRPSPIVMEQCQEALSCLYYLLQRFPSKFVDLESVESGLVPKHSNVLESIVTTILNILKSSAFSRDCFVAAGVSFCAAIQVCLDPQVLGVFIMEGIFYQKTCSSISCRREFQDVLLKVPYNGDVYYEIGNLSVLSRLCLIRGILTAVSRTVLNTHFSVLKDNLTGFEDPKNGCNLVQTILYDGILPELCNYCENPIDSHFNFHALTVLQICLQQIKTSLLANLANPIENYDPIPEGMGTRILRVIWNNLEDPLSQTVKQVHLIFDLFLDIQSTLHWAEGSERIKSFLRKIAADLLRLGPRCKGRYVPLASLTKRLGAKAVLDMNPNLLFETIHAYIDDDVCSAATSFLKCFLEYLRDECWGSDGIERGYAIYRGHCLPPFLYGLASGISKLRSNLNTYTLPVLLEMDADCIFPMLEFISAEQKAEDAGLVYPELSGTNMDLGVGERVAILVSLLKGSRLLALIEGDIDWLDKNSRSQEESRVGKDNIDLYALVCIKGISIKVRVEWLVLALTHVDESLRIDAAELLLLNPKTSSLPSHLELSLMKEAVPLNMRCCSTAFQMKWTSLFRKFFSRVRTALERQFKQGNWRPTGFSNNSEVYQYNRTEEIANSRAEDLFHYMKWLSCFLFFSCYPSAPYERKIMAMELILIMVDVWSIIPPAEGEGCCVSPDKCLYPYNKGLTLPDSTLLLVGSIIDSWDRLRESSFRILIQFPTPLPGISSPEMVQKVIIWAEKLVCSPRVRESDAGALTLRLVFKKYVVELGWMVRASINDVSFHSQSKMLSRDHQICKGSYPLIEYIKSLINWLHFVVEEGEKDLSEACRDSFVHGILLTLRYTFEELDWNSEVILSNISEMRCALEMLLELVMRITSLALWVVSSDAWYLPEDTDDMIDGDTYDLGVPLETNMPVSSSEQDVKNSKPLQDVRPPEQIVMIGCWLAMKEVSLLLGTIIRKIPLPSEIPDSSMSHDNFSGAADTATTMISDMVLDLNQLETIGGHFLEVLLKMKHNGAIDKTRAGFTALCNRLLCSNDPRLCRLTESWMEQLMERTVAKGQIVDDLLRRSAGIPAAFIAFFLSEPEGTPKKLLPWALRWLIDVADRSLLDTTEASGAKDGSHKSLSVEANKEIISGHSLDTNVNEKTSKIRDEGFAAEALIIAIRSFSSQYWEVRNSACLAYTALVRRMIGFLNVQKRESARHALTGLEYFHRYPSLHPFLFNELRAATEFLGDGSSENSVSNLASVVHPSLCPILILLSRLKPSTMASEAGDSLDPFLYMPFIRRCSTQSNLRVRILASRALTGLVSNEKLPSVLLNIASELPCIENQMTTTGASSSLTSHASFNSIHGMLLQIGSLLDTNCRNLADFSKKDKILGDLIQIIVVRSWIGSPKLCPCPTLNTSFLVVLDQMLSIVRKCQTSKNFGVIYNLLLELSSECLDVDTSRSSYYDPTIAELRKQAAISYFSCVFQASKEMEQEVLHMPQRYCPPTPNLMNLPEMENAFDGLQERLILCLSDKSYEVRLATLKWLLQFLKSTDSIHGANYQSSHGTEIIHCWAKTNLQATLMNLLTREKNHRCTHYLLRILFTWNLLQFQKMDDQKCTGAIYVGDMDSDSVVLFWDELVSLFERARHQKIREILICCMGICIKQFSQSFTSYVISDVGRKESIENRKFELHRLDHLYERINYFCNLIKQCSASSEPVNMRKAAAESMVACGLLEQAEVVGSHLVSDKVPSANQCSSFEPKEAVTIYACMILDTWFVCIQLLEDEDVGVRKRLAIHVQNCFASKQYGRNLGAGAVPTQVEKVIELSFEFLSSIFGHWLEYFNHLSRWVLNATNYVVSRGDLVRRVFDKEIDNHHEEKLLISQICCFHLEKLPVSKSWVDFTDKHSVWNFLLEWRTNFANQLVGFAKDHSEIQSGVDWIGGVGNHKDTFLPLYVSLLGFYALSKCIFSVGTEDGRPLIRDVVEVGKTINPFLRNPLIYNLYLLVIKVHEKVFNGTIDHYIPETRGDDAWDNFDPYFLLG